MLTDKQQQILDFILAAHEAGGVFPSVREIMAHMGFASTNTVDYHLRKLDAAGVIERRGRLARSFYLPEGSPAATPARRSSRRASVSSRQTGIPLVGRVAAGEPILAEDNFEGLLDFQDIFATDAETFALRVQGESMINAGIHDGDMVIVRAGAKVENGGIGVAVIGDEATVKRIFSEKAHWRLQPENAAMQPRLVAKNDKTFRLAGKVIGVVRKM
jgi:repressor LexA